MADNKKNDEKDELKEVLNATGGVLSNSMANLAFSFAILMVLSFLGRHGFSFFTGAEEPPEWFGNIVFALFIGAVFSDPYETWKKGKLNYRFFGKFGLGTLFGLSFFLFDIGGETSKDMAALPVEVQTETVSEGEKSFSITQFWPVFLPLLFMPILFGSHALDRFEKNKHAPLKDRLKDAAIEYIATSGPVIMMAVMGVAALFYWIVAMPFNLLIAFLSTLLAAIILYCLFFYDGSEQPVTDEDYVAPRPETFRQGLTTALDISTKMLPGIVFMIGLIWVAMAFWDMDSIDFNNENEFQIFAILWPIIKASLIAILIVPGGMFLANIIFATALAVLAKMTGMGFGELELRSDKFSEMLYGGAMGKLFHGSFEDRKD